MAVYNVSTSLKRHDNANMLYTQGRVTVIRPEDSRGIHSSSWQARTSRRQIDSQERRS
jgi:hypothetical protein